MRGLPIAVLALALTAAGRRRAARQDPLRRHPRLRTAGRYPVQAPRSGIPALQHRPRQVEVDKFADKVGSTFVATIYHGKATYEAGKGPRTTRFICLHGGGGRDAVFVYMLAD
jgi:hypothetical protein